MNDQLNKHTLDAERTIHYLKEKMDIGTTLSSMLLKLVNFKDGDFFTLLPEDFNYAQIYDFKASGVLIPSPAYAYAHLGPRPPTATVVSKIKEEMLRLIFNEITSYNEISCFFGDIAPLPPDHPHRDLVGPCGLPYENEMYYQLGKRSMPEPALKEGLYKSNAVSDSLCILTKANFNNIVDRKLTLAKLEEICLKCRLIFVPAYEGEAYVFWEKAPFFFGGMTSVYKYSMPPNYWGH